MAEIAMQRRAFVTFLGGAVVSSFAAQAQPSQRLARIGYLGPQSGAFNQRSVDAFRAGLRDLGYVEGANIRIDYRWAEREDQLPALAAELVGLAPDVIVTVATASAVMREATATIPIVQAVGPDPVAAGLAATLARPGGNLTGLAFFSPELMAKRIELLNELVSPLGKAGVLLLRGNPSNGSILSQVEAAAKTLNVELEVIAVRGPEEFESAFAAFADRKVGGFVMSDHALFLANLAMIARLAEQQRLPSVGPLELPERGGLMAYGVIFIDLFRRAAVFVDKILKGAQPGDLPIEQATKFKTILNLKTAKAIGLTVPSAFLLRADEVIE